MDDRDRWWDPQTAAEMQARHEAWERMQEQLTRQILDTFAIPKEILMGVKLTNCPKCKSGVSEIAGFVKKGMQTWHVACYEEESASAKLAEQSRVMGEDYARREKELIDTINQLKLVKGESAVVARADPSTVLLDVKQWDEAAERICKLAVAQIGPTLPLHTLKRYAWFIYTKLRDEKLIQPLTGDKPEETKNEAMERSKRELEEWLRSTTVKKEQ